MYIVCVKQTAMAMIDFEKSVAMALAIILRVVSVQWLTS